MDEGKIDLLTDLQARIGCSYISDMDMHHGAAPVVTAARAAICTMDLTRYDLLSLRDAARYLYDEWPTFTSAASAAAYFADKLS